MRRYGAGPEPVGGVLGVLLGGALFDDSAGLPSFAELPADESLRACEPVQALVVWA